MNKGSFVEAVLQRVDRTWSFSTFAKNRYINYLLYFLLLLVCRLLWTCCRPLEWTGSVCDWLSHYEFVQERVTANATKQDGLLHISLVRLAGPNRHHLVLKNFFQNRCSRMVSQMHLISASRQLSRWAQASSPSFTPGHLTAKSHSSHLQSWVTITATLDMSHYPQH